jgi:pyruvate-ferredoxin/flavodoxin oxidoreductase
MNTLCHEDANAYMKEYAEKTYGRKGDAVVELNFSAIDAGYKHLVEIKVKPEWAMLEDEVKVDTERRQISLEKFLISLTRLKGIHLPVSVHS